METDKNVFFSAKFILSQLWPSACNHRSADWWGSSSSWHRPLPSFWLPLPPCELFLPEHLKTEGFAKLIPVCLHQCEVTGNVNIPLRLFSTDLHTLLPFLLAFAADPVLLCSLGTPFLLQNQSHNHFHDWDHSKELMMVFIVQNYRADWFDTCLLSQAHSGLLMNLLECFYSGSHICLYGCVFFIL